MKSDTVGKEKKVLPLGMYFANLTKIYFGALTRRLEHLDIERYYTVLLLLDKQPEACCQQDISNLLKTDKASMVRMIDYLSKLGYIERRTNPSDRREHLLQLTEKGRNTLPEIRQAVSELNELAMAGFSEAEKDTAVRFLQKMEANLENTPSLPLSLNLLKTENTTTE